MSRLITFLAASAAWAAGATALNPILIQQFGKFADVRTNPLAFSFLGGEADNTVLPVGPVNPGNSLRGDPQRLVSYVVFHQFSDESCKRSTANYAVKLNSPVRIHGTTAAFMTTVMISDRFYAVSQEHVGASSNSEVEAAYFPLDCTPQGDGAYGYTSLMSSDTLQQTLSSLPAGLIVNTAADDGGCEQRLAMSWMHCGGCIDGSDSVGIKGTRSLKILCPPSSTIKPSVYELEVYPQSNACVGEPILESFPLPLTDVTTCPQVYFSAKSV
jgi:hypothetical protein